MRLLFDLFFTFVKIGLFTFGGGYAMIPLIERTCVEKKEWITHEEMMNITVIAESTPGPVAINCATYVGLKKKGFWGAVAATFGVQMAVDALGARFVDRIGYRAAALASELLSAAGLLLLPALPHRRHRAGAEQSAAKVRRRAPRRADPPSFHV